MNVLFEYAKRRYLESQLPLGTDGLLHFRWRGNTQLITLADAARPELARVKKQDDEKGES